MPVLWFADVHCDFGKQLVLLDSHHLIGQRVDAVSVHGLSCVRDSVKPGTGIEIVRTVITGFLYTNRPTCHLIASLQCSLSPGHLWGWHTIRFIFSETLPAGAFTLMKAPLFSLIYQQVFGHFL